MLSAETTAARFNIEAPAASREVDGCSFETEVLSASANFWYAPNLESPRRGPVRMTATLSPGLKPVVDDEGTDSTVPAKDVPNIAGYGIGWVPNLKPCESASI